MPFQHPSITEDQRAKLPKWAKTYVNSLERRVQDAESHAEQASFSRSAGKPSNTFIGRHNRMMNPSLGQIYLENNERVSFQVGPDPERDVIDAYVDPNRSFERVRQPVLTINGYRGIVMLPPRASNAVEWRLETYR